MPATVCVHTPQHGAAIRDFRFGAELWFLGIYILFLCSAPRCYYPLPGGVVETRSIGILPINERWQLVGAFSVHFQCHCRHVEEYTRHIEERAGAVVSGCSFRQKMAPQVHTFVRHLKSGNKIKLLALLYFQHTGRAISNYIFYFLFLSVPSTYTVESIVHVHVRIKNSHSHTVYLPNRNCFYD